MTNAARISELTGIGDLGLVITLLEQESDWIIAGERVMHGRTCVGAPPLVGWDIIRSWWEHDIAPLGQAIFLFEIRLLSQIAAQGCSRVEEEPLVAFALFRSYRCGERKLNPQVLRAFDDVFFMNIPLFCRSSKVSCDTLWRYLNSSAVMSKIHRETGADMLLWHRLRDCDVSILKDRRTPACTLHAEATYPVLRLGEDTAPFLDQAAHMRRDIEKQERRIRNAFGEAPRIECFDLDPAAPEMTSEVIRRFAALRRKTWQYSWEAESEKVDVIHYERKLMSYSGIWAAAGALSVYFLTIKGEDAAFWYILRQEDRVWCLLIGYDQSLKTYSPGKTIFYHGLLDMHAKGARVFDLGGNVVGWKEEWSPEIHVVHTCELWLRTKVGLAHRALNRIHTMTGKQVRSSEVESPTS